ncbi:MAG: hypothetical protein OIN66_08785 [Candidatus Methanoperedens sp.]|nr:hypothetical protein [Candidatus Methanoperedens sp.]
MNDKSSLPEVHFFNQALNDLGHSSVGEYLFKYLNNLKAKTYIIENKYIDKDYLIDFSNFYSRSFDIDEKFTTRLHFFSPFFSDKDLKRLLIDYDEKILEKLNSTYLGFVVIKPIHDSNGCPIIGRTVLKTYPLKDKGECRYFVTGLHNLSFFGIPLKIKALPFQTQDKAVGACATAACWIASHPLNDLFGIPKHSPFEVTEKSVVFPSLERNYPSEGLSLYQMKNYFNSIGLETEFIDVRNIHKYQDYTADDDIVTDVVRAYTKIKLPIIATLRLTGENNSAFHAAVISGYRHKHGTLKELYVHDDQIGPYSKVIPIGKFTEWDNEWVKNGEFSHLYVDHLIVPIYPKIRLSFARIYNIFLKKHKRNAEQFESTHGTKFTTTLYLMEVRKYKEFIWKHPCKDKEEVLTEHFPRFLWVIRYTYHGGLIMDYVYDGTSVFPKELRVIDFL